MAASVAALPGSGSSAEASSAPLSSSDLSGISSQQQAQASGMLAYSEHANADGSKTESYKFASGVTATSIVPPPGFSPLTASSEQLATYGFPAKPTTGSDLQLWVKAMTAWKSTPVPKITIQTQSPDAPAATASSNEDFATNGNYTGYANTASSQYYQGAQAEYIAPNVGAGCSGPTIMGVWTGLGGINSPQLIQSGIEAGESLGNPTVWQPFWEILDSRVGWPPILLKMGNTAVPVNPDDVVLSKTTYNPSTPSASFYLEDVTTGQAASYTLTNNGLTGPVSNYYDGSTADYITEFPGNSYGAFQQFAVTNAESYNGSSWVALGSKNHTQFTSTPYATSGPIGSDGKSFAVGFLGC